MVSMLEDSPAPSIRRSTQSTKRFRRRAPTITTAILVFLSAAPGLVSAQADGCVSLEGSEACPAFQSASVNLNDEELGQQYSFLQYVSDRQSFDDQLFAYVKRPYVEAKFVGTFGCDNVNLGNTSEWYARYTRTVICNVVVQRSIESCELSEDAALPLCAEECAAFAQSEAYLTADESLCSSPSDSLVDLIRSDFATCSLPREALSGGTCISAIENESENCGFGNSTIGLCSHCSEGGDLTDRCCYEANAEERCEGIELPPITTTISLDTPTQTVVPLPTDSETGSGNADGSQSEDEDDGGPVLSGGAIAGIVVGAVAGIALIALALFFCLRRKRQSGGSQKGSIFNQPSPARKGPTMAQAHQDAPPGFEVLPGGRIARMSALEGHSGDSSSHRHGSSNATGAGAAYMTGSRKGTDAHSSSASEFGESPASRGVLRPPPTTSRRNGSLSSNSIFGSSVPQSPTDGGYSSPPAVASQQSEQLPFFKDYYSQDDIHPGDRVAVLWAYQPRASDEFALERGDMLKVVGIWDDGWATGIIVDERADEWEARRQAQRDSGVSNASGRRDNSPPASGEIKAFPLVCVCLPDHWKKTIEGDGSTDA